MQKLRNQLSMMGVTSCSSLFTRSRTTARELGFKDAHSHTSTIAPSSEPQQTACGHVLAEMAKQENKPSCVSRAPFGVTIRWSKQRLAFRCQLVALSVVASTRGATGTFHSHGRANETRTEPHVVHLRAMRSKCLIKRIRRVAFFFCSPIVKVRNTIRR